jgi:ParB family chromosome partitioning protein
MLDNNKKSLGKGLEALLGEMNEDILSNEISSIKIESKNVANIEDISVNPYQPRKEFSQEAIESLSLSIKEKGILQPLIVRENKQGNGYELIAGERRLRAAKSAGLKEVPIIIQNLGDKEVLEVALVENILRENLSPLEEGEAYQKLIDDFSHTQEKIAEIVGKSRSYIANTLRLLSLPEKVKDLINKGDLSAGHARCLVGLENAESLAEKIIKENLNVRQVEELVAQQKELAKDEIKDEIKVEKKTKQKDKDVEAIENLLKKNLGLRIKISPNSQGGGKVVMQYSSIAELDMIVNILDNKKDIDISPKNTVFKQVEENNNEKFSIKFVD